MTQRLSVSDAQGLVVARFAQSCAVPELFFARETARIAECCWAIARRFHANGRLLACGRGAWASDAQHVAVEFVHPVIVGKRALPALALLGEQAGGHEHALATQIAALARPQDIAFGFGGAAGDEAVLAALREAQRMGLLTVSFGGGPREAEANFDYRFAVEGADPHLAQETYETLYHILWELVHVFFEHEGLL